MASTRRRQRPSILLTLALTAAGLYPMGAQSQPFNDRWSIPAPKATPPSAGTQEAAAKPKTQLPANLPQSLYLIRSTLLTLNDANRSGNYTVLRDLAAPSFQAKNRSADLARIFADLRSRNFDLFAVALMAPKLSAPPALDGSGMLRLSGVFPTHPLEIKFDLAFQNVDRQWRLFGISVATPEAPISSAMPSTKKR